MRKDIQKLIAEVQILAIEVSMKTKHDVFTRYAGHTQGFEVGICLNGFAIEPKEHRLMLVYMDINSNSEIKKELRRTKRELKKLLEDR